MSWPDDLFVLPYSTLVILLINMCVVLTGGLVFHFMIDVDRLEAQESQVRVYERSLKDAKGKTDKVAMRKLRREGTRIKRISASTSKQRLKVVMITILPFTAITFLLSILYGGKEVALFPFEFPFLNKDELGRITTPFSIWYFVSYLAAYLPISKVFRSSPSFWHNNEAKST